jgi:hypothetical protein
MCSGSSKPVWVSHLFLMLGLLVAAVPLVAQQTGSVASPPFVEEPRPAAEGSTTSTTTTSIESAFAVHRFWDRTNLWLFAGIAASRGLDYASTRNMLARGREEILLPDAVVDNHAGFAALEAAGTATSVGLAYLLHRTGHHKLERWLSIGHIGVATFGDGRNYALKSHHHT